MTSAIDIHFPIRIGFLPLTDCASLAIALELGFFAKYGLCVELRKLQSWMQIRDRLWEDELDAAQMLITMPIQFGLDSFPRPVPVCYAFALSRHGNGIILGNEIWNAGARDAAGLGAWLQSNPEKECRFGVVFPRSTHEYFLRSWLAEGRQAISGRINLLTIAPQEMVGHLRNHKIEGFCVGEPWSRRAATSKLGRLVAESGQLLPGLGEKVLGVKTAWHRSHPREHALLIRALAGASAWLAEPENHGEAADILSSKKYINTPRPIVKQALDDHPPATAAGGRPASIRFFGDGANLPQEYHARWYLEQMRRWDHVDSSRASRLRLEEICLEDFYRETMATSNPGAAGLSGSDCQPPFGNS